MARSLVNALSRPISETDRARHALENVLAATKEAEAAMELINSGSDEHAVLSMICDSPDDDKQRDALRSLAGYADRARRALEILDDETHRPTGERRWLGLRKRGR